MTSACISQASEKSATKIEQINDALIEQNDKSIAIKLRDSHTLEFAYKSAPFTVNRMSDVSLLVALKNVNAHYFLINVIRPSKTGGGRCAAGTERTVVWLKISTQGKVIDSQEVHYESCLLSIESESLTQQSAEQVLSSLQTGLTVFAQMKNERAMLFFDSARPQDGLRVIPQENTSERE